MRSSIATVSLGGGLVEKLECIAAAGFEGVEIFDTDILTHDGPPADIARVVADLGLAIVALQPFRDFECLPEPQRSRAFERAKRKFALMNELQAETLLVCSSTSPLALGGIDRAADDLRALGEIAQSFGVKVGYEALAWGRHVSDYRDAWEIVRRADHPQVGLILDSWHILARDLPVEPIRAIAADKIAFVQIADAPWLNMDLLQWSRHFRNFPGQGDLDVGGFIAALLATDFDGWLSHEIFNDQFRMANPRRIAEDGRRSLSWLMDGQGRTNLPPPARCEAVEFVEFAVDDAQAAELAGLFAGLGFRHAGDHRSKDVALWAQGDIHLIVNREQESFAHSHYVVHGPSVCTLGLRVNDAAAAMARAEGLRVRAFHQPVGPGELAIPAIRGLGGSLIHFTDSKGSLARLWEVDFVPAADPSTDVPDAGVGLARIDHIAQAMPHEETLSWRLFYLSLFDFERTPQVDIVDPAGIVESQVVQSPDRGVRICLNASQSGRTMASRFLSEYYGAGVQHIAFATGDIFATVVAMLGNGVDLLPVPDNYYDDLEARLALEPALVDRMRALGILYDEDDAGAYFQVYTHVFANRFFFEVVERRGAYRGFGAANAPVRLAAQSRLSPALGPV